MSLETECEFCRHRKASHLVFRDGMNQFLDCGVTDCQCPKFVCDSEGFDIQDVKESGDTPQSESRALSTPVTPPDVLHGDQVEYDASNDSVSPLQHYMSGAERSVEEMVQATKILLDKEDAKISSNGVDTPVVNDPVNHPSHYTAYPGVEVIQLTRWMSFNLGNAVKYISRAGLKDSDKEIQDLEKAIWYIKDEIARKKGEYGEQQK